MIQQRTCLYFLSVVVFLFLILVYSWPEQKALGRLQYWAKIAGSHELKEQGIRVGPGVICYEHTNDHERALYGKSRGFYSCLAEELCLDMDPSGNVRRFVVPVHDANQTSDPIPFISNSGPLQIQFENMQQPRNKTHSLFPILQSEMTVLQWRFCPLNAFHELIDQFSVLFETAYSTLGRIYYDPKLSGGGVHRETVRMVEMAIIQTGDSRPFNPLYDALTAYGYPVVHTFKSPVCFKKTWIGLPSIVRPDARTERNLPDRDATARIARLLMAREAVRYLIQTHVGDVPFQKVENTYLENHIFPSLTCSDREPYSACDMTLLRRRLEFLYQVEQQAYWPKTKWSNGTLILYIPRTRNRRVKNEPQLMERLDREFTQRGYPVVFQDMANIPYHEQILLASRATVIIGAHGAGLAHAMWMQPFGSSLVELLSYQNSRRWFPMLASDHHLTYLCYRSPMRLLSIYEQEDADFDVDLDIVTSIVKFAVHHSDRFFGPPKAVTMPVTAGEAALAIPHLHNATEVQIESHLQRWPL